MLTNVGKFLRKLRIDQGEILRDMAEKLQVTVSFLSAVENGRKKMPSAWNNKICDLYDLNDQQMREFTTAIANTENELELNFTDAELDRKELAISFARRFSSIDNAKAEQIRKILHGGD